MLAVIVTITVFVIVSSGMVVARTFSRLKHPSRRSKGVL